MKMAWVERGAGPARREWFAGLGWSMWLAGLWLAASRAWAATNAPDEIPPLRPPRPELGPGYWEQNGWWVGTVGAVLAIAVVAVIWYWRRPRSVPVVPPEVRARKDLEALRDRQETGAVLSRVSHIVRHYYADAFGLQGGELTTAELCRLARGSGAIGGSLSARVEEFLVRCDERKFSPPAPAPPLGAVGEALGLVEQGEARRAELRAAEVKK